MIAPTCDACALAALHAAATHDAWGAPAFAALLAEPSAFALWAPGAGFVLMRAAAQEAEVLQIAVRPAARRAGLGRALLRAGLAAAAARGARVVFLEAAADNAAAQALYAAEGFVQVGRRRAYYARPGAAPADALVLRRALDTPPPRPHI